MTLEKELEVWDYSTYAPARRALVERLTRVEEVDSPTVSTIRRGTDVKRRPAEYLWHPYIPAGELTAIAGQGEAGKTWLFSKVGATVTAAGELPKDPSRKNGRPSSVKPADVLLIQRENDESAVILPRFEAMGGDSSRLVLPSETFSFSSGSGGGDLESFLRLAWYLEATDAKLVFIDPITGFFDGRMNDAGEVRVVLERLQVVARFTGAAITYVLHLNKDVEKPIQYRIMSSVEFYNVPRSVLIVTPDPDGSDEEDVEDKLVYHKKNNLGKRGGALGFRLSGDISGDGVGFIWSEPDSSLSTVQDLLNGDGAAEKRTKPGQIKDEMVRLLYAADGIVPTTLLKSRIAEGLGWENGVSRSNWQRATADLPFRPVEIRKDDGSGGSVVGPGSGVWGYRPLGSVGEDGVARVAAVSDDF
jgi:putative DNA primase/helicase